MAYYNAFYFGVFVLVFSFSTPRVAHVAAASWSWLSLYSVGICHKSSGDLMAAKSALVGRTEGPLNSLEVEAAASLDEARVPRSSLVFAVEKSVVCSILGLECVRHDLNG